MWIDQTENLHEGSMILEGDRVVVLGAQNHQYL